MIDRQHPADPRPVEPRSRVDVVIVLIIFQFKLFVDGLRDLLFSPLSLVAALAGVLVGGHDPDRYLRRLMEAGRRTDRWINLFGAHRGPGGVDQIIQPAANQPADNACKETPMGRRSPLPLSPDDRRAGNANHHDNQRRRPGRQDP